MFYSALTSGFYDAALHGARQIDVPDPAWVRPRRDVTLQPGESIAGADGELIANNTDEPVTLTAIPDMDTIAPTIAIDNPDCRIPRDAVEISAEDYAALLDAQSAGKQIVPDGHGHPIAVDPPPPSEAELAAQVRAERDRRLADSDWTQIGDAPASTAARWQPYRQALRDVPAQPGFPHAVIWPIAP